MSVYNDEKNRIIDSLKNRSNKPFFCIPKDLKNGLLILFCGKKANENRNKIIDQLNNRFIGEDSMIFLSADLNMSNIKRVYINDLELEDDIDVCEIMDDIEYNSWDFYVIYDEEDVLNDISCDLFLNKLMLFLSDLTDYNYDIRLWIFHILNEFGKNEKITKKIKKRIVTEPFFNQDFVHNVILSNYLWNGEKLRKQEDYRFTIVGRTILLFNCFDNISVDSQYYTIGDARIYEDVNQLAVNVLNDFADLLYKYISANVEINTNDIVDRLGINSDGSFDFLNRYILNEDINFLDIVKYLPRKNENEVKKDYSLSLTEKELNAYSLNGWDAYIKKIVRAETAKILSLKSEQLIDEYTKHLLSVFSLVELKYIGDNIDIIQLINDKNKTYVSSDIPIKDKKTMLLQHYFVNGDISHKIYVYAIDYCCEKAEQYYKEIYDFIIESSKNKSRNNISNIIGEILRKNNNNDFRFIDLNDNITFDSYVKMYTDRILAFIKSKKDFWELLSFLNDENDENTIKYLDEYLSIITRYSHTTHDLPESKVVCSALFSSFDKPILEKYYRMKINKEGFGNLKKIIISDNNDIELLKIWKLNPDDFFVDSEEF